MWEVAQMNILMNTKWSDNNSNASRNKVKYMGKLSNGYDPLLITVICLCDVKYLGNLSKGYDSLLITVI